MLQDIRSKDANSCARSSFENSVSVGDTVPGSALSGTGSYGKIAVK